jgi:hypothetical protein
VEGITIIPRAWRLAAALVLGLGSAPACTAAEPGGTAIRARPIVLPEAGERIGQLRLLAVYELNGGKGFGGLSSVQLDGSGILFLSDRARLFRAERVEDPSGRLTALTDWTEPRLPRVLSGADTEALTRLPDGSFVIGTEDRDELYRLPPDLAAATTLPLPPFLRKAPPNESIEAVAALPDGSLLTASEGIAAGPGAAMAALMFGTEATRVALPAADGFRPTDATVAGRTLFLLERRLSLLGGLGGRLMAIPLDTIRRPPVEAQAIAQLGIGSFAENFEGVAAREVEPGRYLLYLVSDDNFGPLLRTLLLQLEWREPEAAGQG